jgi:DHA1 family tetracycline resistance protein-like MFS transporter
MLLSIVIIYKVLNREKKEHPELLEVIKGSGGLETPMH